MCFRYRYRVRTVFVRVANATLWLYFFLDIIMKIVLSIAKDLLNSLHPFNISQRR